MRICSAIKILVLLLGVVINAQDLELPKYKQYSDRDGLPQQQVTTLFEDSRGYIWVGTKNGVARFNGKEFYAFTTKNGFPFRVIEEIREDQQKRILVFSSEGIARINGNEIETFPLNQYVAETFDLCSTETIWFTAKNNKAEWFIGCFSKDKYTFYPLPFHNELSVSVKHAHQQDEFYIFTNTEFYAYNLKDNKLQSHPFVLRKKGYILKSLCVNENVIASYKKINTDHFLFYQMSKNQHQLIGEYQNGSWQRQLPSEIRNQLRLYIPNQAHFIEKGKVKYVSMPEQFIINGLEDSNGVQWFSTERGLTRMFSEAFTHYNPHLLSEVWAVVEQPKGKFWFPSYSFSTKTLEKNILKEEQMPSMSNHSGYYFHPVKDDKDQLYFAWSKGVVKRSPKGKTKILEYHWQGDPNALYVFYDKQRSLLLGGFRNNVVFWNNKEERIRVVGRESQSDMEGYVLCVAKDSVGDYWFAARDIYRYQFDKNQLKKYTFTHQEKRIRAIDIATDFSGRVWFGANQGLFYYDRKKDSLQKFECAQLEDGVSTVFPIDEKRLLFSQPHGLYILDLESFEKGNVKLSLYNETNGYLGNEAGQTGAFRDSEGKIWITGSYALAKIDPNLLPSHYASPLNLVFKSYNNVSIKYNENKIKLPKDQHSVTITFDPVALNYIRPVWYRYRLDDGDSWSEPQTENYITLTNLPHGKTTLEVRAWFQGLEESYLDNRYTIDIYVNKIFYNQAWFVPAVIFLLLITIAIISYVQKRTQTRLRKTIMLAKISEVETIQSQMNPHFVYNVLANVQSKIRNLQTEQAENVLLKLAGLMRKFLHTSTVTTTQKEDTLQIKQHLVSLSYELVLLQEFIDFQQMLYPNSFDYRLIISDDVDVNQTKIPPMLLQPFVENAISHGLIPNTKKGTLTIFVKRKFDRVYIEIKDDGVGLEVAKQKRKISKLRYPSQGRRLTLKRIKLLRELGFEIEVITRSSAKGTKVMLIFG